MSEFGMCVGARSTLYIPALTLPFSSVFSDSFSITLLYSRRRGSWLWHSPVNNNTAIICVMGLSLNLTTPIKFSLTLINTDLHSILCKVYNRVDSSNITSQTWKFYFFRFFRQKTETEFSKNFKKKISKNWTKIKKNRFSSPLLNSVGKYLHIFIYLMFFKHWGFHCFS